MFMLALQTVWDPTSKGIEIGSFTIHYYSMMWMVAFILGWYVIKKIYKNEEQPEEKLDSLFIYSIVGIMLGARLGHVIFYQAELITEDFFSIFLPFKFKGGIEFTGFQGLASHGAAIGMIIAMYLYNKKVLKKSVIWVLDRVVIPVALGAIFVRLGNFFNSEIIGKPTDSSLGVIFKQAGPGFDNVARHPSQLYEATCYVFVFLILWFVYWKTKKREQLGYIFGSFLVLLWTVRFFVEYVKEPQNIERADWILNTGQLLSIPLILIGLYFMFGYKPKAIK